MALIPETRTSEGISVVIPCLSEEQTIARAVTEALTSMKSLSIPYEVIVADNGSKDRSRELAIEAGARVVNVSTLGYGAALHEGILAARYRWVCFGDADLSYPFTEIPRLIAPLLEGKADFVLGSRLGGTIEAGAMPFLNRYLGTPVLSFLIRRIHGVPTSDCNSGMRAMSRESYIALDSRCSGMEFASEMLIGVGQRKLRYTEVEIPFRKDARSGRPHLRRWRDGWRHLRFILGNASSTYLIMAPLVLGLFLLAYSFVLTLPIAPELHYHSALAVCALAIPLLMLSLSFILTKAVLHESGKLGSRLIRRLQLQSDQGRPFYLSLFIYSLGLVQLLWISSRWAANGFGPLSELPALIRIMDLTLLATFLFCLDLGLGLIRLVARDRLRSA